MLVVSFIPTYLFWHYSRGTRELFENCKSVLWFISNIFSIKLLSRTLFAPWRRLDVKKVVHEKIGDKLERYIVSGLMRVFGAVIRVVTIVLGVGAWMTGLVIAVATVVVWLLLPVVLLAGIYKIFLIWMA